MGNIENDLLTVENRKPWLSLLSIVLLAIGGLLVGQSIGIAVVVGIYGYGLIEIMEGITNVSADFKIPIFIIQGFTALVAFILAPLAHLYFIDKRKYAVLSPLPTPSWVPLLLTIFIAIIFIPVNFKFMEWNSQLELTEWMTQQEQNLEKVTTLLTTMDHFGEFLLAMLVIAVLPAIGEELLFRGLIQNKLQSWTRNAHVAIWITAIFFSAIHMQFYGFLPRMILGALFGYLYFWSGNLTVPILGHFVNNGFQVIMLYIYQNRLTELNIDEVESVPWPAFLSTALISIALLYYFKRHYTESAQEGVIWQKIYATDKSHQAEIVKAVLAEKHLNPVLINKKDSAYDRFGDIEIHVTSEHVLEALKIIDNDINFD